MKKLSKKQIIIIITVAVIAIALVIAGVMFCMNNGKSKENSNDDGKVESVERNETEEEKEKDSEQGEADETVVVEDGTEESTTETQTPEVEEPKQETTQQQQQSSSNMNNNQNGSSNNSGGATTPSNPTPTPAPTPTPEPEKSPYAGMYTMMDEASKTRLLQCANILKGGLVGDARYEYNMVDYFDGHIAISASNTSGAWMYITIGYWDTNAQIASEEMKPCYNEIPVLMKQCFEALAPEGGTDLYNTINSLIHQYGGPRKVPTQGIIRESIPGLSIDVKKGKNGLEIRFFAE